MSNLYIPRRLEQDVARFVGSEVPHKPVLLLDGARQVGKTTLVDDGFEVTNLPAYLLERLGDSRST